jgi:GT2 family glycosyltransferase
MKKIKFSIIIALAPWRDAEVVPSLKSQNFSKKDFEIIIKKGLNVPDNRNNGLKEAKGEIIIFLDDDALIENDFLSKIDEFFKTYPEIDILGGPQLTPSTDKFFAKLNGYALTSSFIGPSINKRYNKSAFTLNANSSYITGALLIAKKEVFKKLTFQREIYPSDDVHFIDNAKKNKFKVAYSPDIFIYHRRRKDIQSLVKQIFDYGFSRAKFTNKLKSVFDILFIVPSLFVIYSLLLPILFSLNSIFIFPIILYLLISIIISLRLSLSNKEPIAFLFLPFLFLIIHTSYGIGFLTGLFQRIFKRGEKLNEK